MSADQTETRSGPTVHSVPTSTGRLAVYEHAARQPGAPTALLWHSMFADSSAWAELLPALTAHRRLLVIDGPGYGASAPLRHRSSIAESALVAEEVLGHLGVSQVDWLGNGWGGHAGLHLAATRPERVRSLVAISAPVSALTGRSAPRFAFAVLVLVLLCGLAAARHWFHRSRTPARAG